MLSVGVVLGFRCLGCAAMLGLLYWGSCMENLCCTCWRASVWLCAGLWLAPVCVCAVVVLCYAVACGMPCCAVCVAPDENHRYTHFHDPNRGPSNAPGCIISIGEF